MLQFLRDVLVAVLAGLIVGCGSPYCNRITKAPAEVQFQSGAISNKQTGNALTLRAAVSMRAAAF